MHEVLLEKRAEKDLDRLPADRFQQIISVIQSLKENPRPHGCKKLEGGVSDWRIRVGVYRVLYEIDDKAKCIRIMRVRHRRESYR